MPDCWMVTGRDMEGLLPLFETGVLAYSFSHEDRLLKAKEVQELLGLGRTKVYEMMNSGELPVVTLGDRSTRVPLKALLKWLEERTTGGREVVN